MHKLCKGLSPDFCCGSFNAAYSGPCVVLSGGGLRFRACPGRERKLCGEMLFVLCGRKAAAHMGHYLLAGSYADFGALHPVHGAGDVVGDADGESAVFPMPHL